MLISFHIICVFLVCCPNNTYGKDCSPCPGGVDRPCNGNGACDVSHCCNVTAALSYYFHLCFYDLPFLLHLFISFGAY